MGLAFKLGIKNDERIRLLEDHPKWINVVKSGVKLHFIPEPLVLYRLSDTSISTNKSFSKPFVKSLKKCYWLYQYENKKKKWGWRYTMFDYCCYCASKTDSSYWKCMRKICKILGFKKAKKK